MRMVFALVLATTPVAADPGAVDWIVSQTQSRLEAQQIGSLDIAAGGVLAVDALVLFPIHIWKPVVVSAGSARLFVLFDVESGRVSKAALVLGDTTPVCGHDETAMLIDSGLGSFIDRRAAAELEAIGKSLRADQDIYSDFLAPLLPEGEIAAIIDLPGGSRFPVFSTGWGDGAYPVASLTDAEGKLIAVYVDFLGYDEAGAWLLPPECSKIIL